MTNKRQLIVDVDSTIVNSQKAICTVYNRMFHDNEKFVKADWTKVTKWNMSGQCPLLEEYKLSAIDLFKTKEFFNVVEFYEGAKESLEKLSRETKIIICTSGTPENVAHKVLWINENLPFADIVPVIIKGSNGYGKKIVNMENSVFIDDHAHNLETSNADEIVCFGKEYEWNKDFKGNRVDAWDNDTVNFIKELLIK